MDDITDIVGYALNAPLELGWGLLKGGALLLFSFLLVPGLTVLGYVMRLIRDVANDEEIPPIDDLGTLTIVGGKAFVIFFPIYVVQIVVGRLPVMVFDNNLVIIGSQASSLILGFFFLPVIIEYAVTRDWKQSYSPKSIGSYVSKKEYIGDYIVFFVLYMLLVAVGTVLSLLTVLTIIGWVILIPSIFFGVLVVQATFLGKMYAAYQE